MYYLSDYQTFGSVQEMDTHVQQHINVNFHELNQTDLAVLSLISRYACKYPGVAHLKVETITKSLSKSDATIRRAIRKLERLHVIEKIQFIRRVAKGYGANILRVLPNNDNSPVTTRTVPKTLTPVSTEPTKMENKSFNSNNLIQDTYDTEDALEKGLLIKLPSRIGRTLSAFFDRSTIYEIYGVMLRAKARITRSITFEQYEDAYNDAILSVVNAYKRGQVKNL
ncbi:helix-turn-helix domain-containing protein [Paenisporosarcina indica]|uniref:helix-turn-helix domain-containing protein n=1 Tax=Paenisporosarcina indica TaxID=650093 RepID=UPI00094F7E20|nr:helix-turn-helix domain-containing protein [Paenisporosarcina indica]